MTMTELSSRLHPSLGLDEFLRALRSSADIHTARDILAADPQELARRTGAELKEILDIRLACLERVPLAATSPLDPRAWERRLRLGTGSAAADALLQGGMLPGRVYEVYGPPGAGKTQLCLSAAAGAAAAKGGRVAHRNVAYVDAKGDFRVQRLVEVLRRGHRETVRGQSRVLERVRVLRASNLSGLRSELERAARAAEEGGGEGAFWRRMRLLVLDSVASLVLPELDEQDGGMGVGGAFRAVEAAVRLLRRLARACGAVVLVTNHAVVVRGEDGGAKEEMVNKNRVIFKRTIVKVFIFRDRVWARSSPVRRTSG